MSLDDVAGDPRAIVTGGAATIGRYAVIGHPIDHSRSPALHQCWFQAADLAAVYERVDIGPLELVARGPSLPFEFAGLNITRPHKVAILGYADRVDPSASRAGAANLLYRAENGAWTAGNTDGAGFVKALEEAIIDEIAGKDVVLLGAGGAARAIGSALVDAGVATLTIANRSQERAEQVCAATGASGTVALVPDALDRLEVSVDMVVNTLPDAAESLLESFDLSPLASGATVADINYHDPRPALLRRAAEAGLQVIDGRGMFLWQAALSFEAWMGRPPHLELGRKLLGIGTD